MVCDLELLATGAFSPLDRFMGRLDHARVVDEMRLQSGALFPIPVTLPIEPDADVHLDADLALRSPKNELLAVLTVEEIYGWDADEVATQGVRDARPAPPARGRDASLGPAQRLGSTARAATAAALRLPRAAADTGAGARSGWRAPVTPTWSPSRRATRCTASTRS